MVGIRPDLSSYQCSESYSFPPAQTVKHRSLQLKDESEFEQYECTDQDDIYSRG